MRDVGSPIGVDPVDGRERALALGVRDRWAGRPDRPYLRAAGAWLFKTGVAPMNGAIEAATARRAPRRGHRPARCRRRPREAVHGRAGRQRLSLDGDRGGTGHRGGARTRCPRRRAFGAAQRGARGGARRRRLDRARVRPRRRGGGRDGEPRHHARQHPRRACARGSPSRRRPACRASPGRGRRRSTRRAWSRARRRSGPRTTRAWRSPPAATSVAARCGPTSWPGRSTSLVAAGLEPVDALAAATWRGGELLGEADAGVIREGGPADFFCVHGDPLSEPEALWRVWRAGWDPG